MNTENTFHYTYNATENQQILQIRNKYLPHEKTGLEELKALDSKVKRPANVFAWIFGSLSAIIMGAGMSLVMTDIGQIIGLSDGLIPGICTGLVGMGLAFLTYPLYKGIVKSRTKKYGPRILELSEKMMEE